MPRQTRIARMLVLMLVLAPLLGLGACKKKPSPDNRQPSDSMSAGMIAADGKDDMEAMEAMDGIGEKPPILRHVMEVPDTRSDAGVVAPKGNKGMIPKKKLADPTE